MLVLSWQFTVYSTASHGQKYGVSETRPFPRNVLLCSYAYAGGGMWLESAYPKASSCECALCKDRGLKGVHQQTNECSLMSWAQAKELGNSKRRGYAAY